MDLAVPGKTLVQVQTPSQLPTSSLQLKVIDEFTCINGPCFERNMFREALVLIYSAVGEKIEDVVRKVEEVVV